MRTKLPKRATILETWQSVYQFYWDSGFRRTRIEVVEVLRNGDVYAVLSPYRSRPVGPYKSLEEALRKHGLTDVTGLTTEVCCPTMETKQLARLLDCDFDEPVGLKLKINGEFFVLTPARIFGRCRNQDDAIGHAVGSGESVRKSPTLVEPYF